MQQHTLVDQAISSRHSVRAFKNTPLDTQTIKDILNIACRAPSGNNIQPWKVYVVNGQKRKELIQQVCAVQSQIFAQPEIASRHQETFKYYPEQWTSPFIERSLKLQAVIKKRLSIILSNGHRHLLSAAVKMAGDFTVCWILKKVNSKKCSSSIYVIISYLMLP